MQERVKYFARSSLYFCFLYGFCILSCASLRTVWVTPLEGSSATRCHLMHERLSQTSRNPFPAAKSCRWLSPSLISRGLLVVCLSHSVEPQALQKGRKPAHESFCQRALSVLSCCRLSLNCHSLDWLWHTICISCAGRARPGLRPGG